LREIDFFQSERLSKARKKLFRTHINGLIIISA